MNKPAVQDKVLEDVAATAAAAKEEQATYRANAIDLHSVLLSLPIYC